MALVLLTAGALAEEQLFTDRVELFSEGSLASQPYVRAKSADGFDAYIIEALNAQTERISVSSYGMTLDVFKVEYWRVLNEYPELFFVSGAFRYSYNGQGIVTAVLPTYKYQEEELRELQGIYHSGLSAIVSYARKADTTVGRLLRANDYICANYEYDLDYSIYSPELMFKNGKGVCQAYMLVYKAVCRELGVESTSVVSEEMNHTWNLVRVDGAWYHVDVTWNDPIDDIPLRAKHNNFLLSDAGITAERHSGWDGDVKATSTKYDSWWWRNLRQAIPVDGDVAYCLSNDGSTILAYDLRTETMQTAAEIEFTDFSSVNAYSLCVHDGMFYFASGKKLYAMPVSGGTPMLVWTADASGSIWYPILMNGKLHFLVSENLYQNGTLCAVSLIRPDCVLTVTPTQAVLRVGETQQLTALLTPEPSEAYPLTWESADAEIVRVDAQGRLLAVHPGVTQVIVRLDATRTAACDVLVMAEELLVLPEELTAIGAEAFAGAAIQGAELPDGVKTIGARAFADNAELLHVNIPAGVEEIAADAFDGCAKLVLLCKADTYGATFAEAQSIPCMIVP